MDLDRVLAGVFMVICVVAAMLMIHYW